MATCWEGAANLVAMCSLCVMSIYKCVCFSLWVVLILIVPGHFSTFSFPQLFTVRTFSKKVYLSCFVS